MRGIVYTGIARYFRAEVLPELRRAAMSGATLETDTGALQRRLDHLMREERGTQSCASGMASNWQLLKAAWELKHRGSSVTARRYGAGAFGKIAPLCVKSGGLRQRSVIKSYGSARLFSLIGRWDCGSPA